MKCEACGRDSDGELCKKCKECRAMVWMESRLCEEEGSEFVPPPRVWCCGKPHNEGDYCEVCGK